MKFLYRYCVLLLFEINNVKVKRSPDDCLSYRSSTRRSISPIRLGLFFCQPKWNRPSWNVGCSTAYYNIVFYSFFLLINNWIQYKSALKAMRPNHIEIRARLPLLVLLLLPYMGENIRWNWSSWILQVVSSPQDRNWIDPETKLYKINFGKGRQLTKSLSTTCVKRRRLMTIPCLFSA